MQIVDLQYAPNGIQPVVHVSQNDVGRQFKLRIFDGSTPYTMPSGTTARIDGIKPDNKGFSYVDAVSVNGNEITVTTQKQMTIVSGIVECEIRFLKGASTIGTLNFKMDVEASPINEDTDISETVLPAIFELAKQQEENAEAWARGTKNGVTVGSSEPQYHNNAKYYSEQSANSATASANSASASASSANASASSATASANSAILSKSWAVGGTNIRSGEDTNNSAYWCRQAQSATQDMAAYVAIIRLILGTVYLITENGYNLATENGDKIIIDF